MNILISDISSYKAIVICKYLKKNYAHLTVYSFDRLRFTSLIRTKYSDKHFHINSSDYFESVKSIIIKNNIEIFIPVNSNEIEMFVKKKKKIGKSLHYLSSYSSFKTLNEKDLLHKLAKDLGINVPMLYSSIKNAKVKFVIKPKNLSSARDVKYIFNKTELEKAILDYTNNTDIVIQEYVEGVGVGYSVFAQNGKIVTRYGHKRLAEYPISGGSSVYRETYSNEKMVRIAAKIIKATKWSGFAMFEFKLTPSNEIYLIEVNPRIWGSINQGLQNGVNYFSELLGKKNNEKSEKEMKTYLSPLVYLSFLKYIFKLKPKPIVIFLHNIFKNKSDISLFDDFGGWVSIILRKIL